MTKTFGTDYYDYGLTAPLGEQVMAIPGTNPPKIASNLQATKQIKGYKLSSLRVLRRVPENSESGNFTSVEELPGVAN